MPDLHEWITQQIGRVEGAARSADKDHGRTWRTRWYAIGDYFELIDDLDLLVADQVQSGVAGLMVMHDPENVLRRCEADRKILAEHEPIGGSCDGCGFSSEYGYEVENINDCPTLQALAEGYGITEEQLATLDQPQPPPRPERPTPRAWRIAGKPTRGKPTSSAPPALRGPNWKD